jgi:hypothetical protein
MSETASREVSPLSVEQIREIAALLLMTAQDFDQIANRMRDNKIPMVQMKSVRTLNLGLKNVSSGLIQAQTGLREQLQKLFVTKGIGGIDLPPPAAAMSMEEQTKLEVEDVIRRAKEKGISVTDKAKEPKETKKKR